MKVGTNTLVFLNNVNFPPGPIASDLILSDSFGHPAVSFLGLPSGVTTDFSDIRVGIGAGDPQSQLHLHNGSLAGLPFVPRDVNARFTKEATGNTSADGLRVGIDVSGAAEIAQLEASPVTVLTSGVARMTVSASGDVGVGTTAPQAKLHVAGVPGVDGIMFPDGSVQTTAATRNSFDSGWFAVAANSDYNLTHNLGTTAVVASLWFSTDSSGSGLCYGPAPLSWREHNPQATSGAAIRTLDATGLTVRTGCDFRFPSASPGCDAHDTRTSGFVRVVIIGI